MFIKSLRIFIKSVSENFVNFKEPPLISLLVLNNQFNIIFYIFFLSELIKFLFDVDVIDPILCFFSKLILLALTKFFSDLYDETLLDF